MALNINVPQANQTLAITQPLILNNFNAINTAFAVDHVNFNDPGQGKHNKITFPVQNPASTFPTVGDLGLFSFLNTTTTKNELNVYKANNAGYVNVPFTASTLSNSAPVAGGSGWSYLPSGLIIQWGTATGINSTLNATVLSAAIPFTIVFPNQVLSVQISLATVGAVKGIFTSINDLTTANFKIATFRTRSAGLNNPNDFYYFAIGY